MFEHILLPTDGSKLSEKSVKQGVRMAKALKASVTALYVSPKFHTFTYPVDTLESTRDDYAEASKKSASNYLDFVRKVGPQARASSVTSCMSSAISPSRKSSRPRRKGNAI
jgi:nucleotide-binding universal stress UspA family protein